MFRELLTQYLKENNSDIYYRRNGERPVDLFVEKIFSGQIRIVDAFEWSRFKEWSLRSHKVSVTNIVQDWHEYQEYANANIGSILYQLRKKYPEFFTELPKKLDVESLL